MIIKYFFILYYKYIMKNIMKNIKNIEKKHKGFGHLASLDPPVLSKQ